MALYNNENQNRFATKTLLDKKERENSEKVHPNSNEVGYGAKAKPGNAEGMRDKKYGGKQMQR